MMKINIANVNREYQENLANIWRFKFTWKGEDGRGLHPQASILEFLKNSNEGKIFLKSFGRCKSVGDFFRLVDNTSKEYYTYCIQTNTIILTPTCESSLRNHFKGTIGEFFYTLFLQTHSVIQTKDSVLRFEDVTPTFASRHLSSNFHDTGIDAVCTYRNEKSGSTHNTVIQYKFWNPGNEDFLKIEVFQKAFTDGVIYDLIDPSEDKQVLILWTGPPKTVSLEYNLIPRSRYVDIIGSDVIDKALKQDVSFWGHLTTSLFKLT